MRAEHTLSRSKSRIYLIGMMGAGKTVIGRQLAEKLHFAFVDTDALIENQGPSIAEIFKMRGESTFRKIERDALKTCTGMTNTVIATGGGLPHHFNNLEVMLSNGVVIYLKSSMTLLVNRLDADFDKRPLLSSESDVRIQQIESLLFERKSGYERAHHIVDNNEGDNDAIVDEIVGLLRS